MVDFVLKEFNEVPGYGARGGVFGCVRLRLVRVVGLNDCYHFFGINRNVRCSDPVFWSHDKIWLSIWRKIGHCDVVEALEGRSGSIDFDNDFIGHLYQFRACADTGARNDSTIFGNGTCFDLFMNLVTTISSYHVASMCAYDRDIQFVPFLLFCVKSVHEIHWKHAQMLVEELDVASIDSPCDLLANLMRAPSFNHVQTRPAIFGLCPR